MTPLISVSEDKTKPPSELPLRIFIFFRTMFDDVTGGSANFAIVFTQYLFLRLRLVLVLASTTFRVLVLFLDQIKDFLTSFLFWGRSPFYRWAVQGMAVMFVVIFALIQFYRKPQLIVSAQTVDVASIEAAENDLIVETGSTETLIPKSRGRLDTVVYVVQPGDTISGVASKFGLKSSTILWANDLSSKSVLKSGQNLEIPEGDGVLHKVKSGDTLASIAKKYDSNDQAIAQVNWIDDPSQLPVGEEIFVPNGKIKVVIPPTIASTKKSGGTFGGSSSGGGADPAGSSSLIWPVGGGGGHVTQCPRWYHRAIDIADKSAPPIRAARSGTVVFAGNRDPYGYANEVVINHGNGLYTQYAHLSYISVRSGTGVSAGQTIGRMGSTGYATGVHLHFEVRNGPNHSNALINPQKYLVANVCGG